MKPKAEWVWYAVLIGGIGWLFVEGGNNNKELERLKVENPDLYKQRMEIQREEGEAYGIDNRD